MDCCKFRNVLVALRQVLAYALFLNVLVALRQVVAYALFLNVIVVLRQVVAYALFLKYIFLLPGALFSLQRHVKTKTPHLKARESTRTAKQKRQENAGAMG